MGDAERGQIAKTKKRKKHTRTDFERKHGELVAAVPQGPNFLLRVVGPAFAAASIIALFIVAEMMIHGRVRRRRHRRRRRRRLRSSSASTFIWIFGLLVNLSSQLLLLFFYLLEIIFSSGLLERARFIS